MPWATLMPSSPTLAVSSIFLVMHSHVRANTNGSIVCDSKRAYASAEKGKNPKWGCVTSAAIAVVFLEALHLKEREMSGCYIVSVTSGTDSASAEMRLNEECILFAPTGMQVSAPVPLRQGDQIDVPLNPNSPESLRNAFFTAFSRTSNGRRSVTATAASSAEGKQCHPSSKARIDYHPSNYELAPY